ncbi:MAG: alkaline phosphatase family protein [Candidatus Binatia bacterium]
MKRLLSFTLLALVAACSSAERPPVARRVVVLGFDGLDPKLLGRFMEAGELPHFAELAAAGGVQPLGTTMPPQSPVAWSTIITGLDPGGHGIYDFVHRDPAPPGGLAILPYLSTSRVEEEEWRVTLGPYALPLRSGKTELLRRGKAFWNLLEERGVPATVVKIPANFPPEPSRARTLSDMGTPDMRGTYGTFFFFGTETPGGKTGSVSGGVIERVTVEDGRVRASVPGPQNPFRADLERARCEFEAFLDPDSGAVKIEIGGEKVVLAVGEWSDWVPVRFDLVPGVASVAGIVRFHLQEVAPDFRLYVTPVNLSPADPALPISTPPEYVQDLFERVGYFYTQGIPELTAALTADVLDDGDFLDQARDIYEERLRLLELELGRFRDGFLFVYFGGADQVSHMFWRSFDEDHPAHDSGAHRDAILATYRELDAALGRTLAALEGGPDTTLIVLSDHGFAPFARAVHLNSWLRDEGFLALRGGAKAGGELYRDVDWPKTRAYGLGLNGLYVNLAGRERYGTVAAGEREALVEDLARRLLEWRDPDGGASVVSRVYRREEIYSAAHRDIAPDLVVGYAHGYRVSNESALGEAPAVTIEDNEKKWSGDHCIAADLVPGVLLANRPVEAGAWDLEDVAPTILALFGIEPPKEMTGKPFLR